MNEKINVGTLLKKLLPYVLPYRWLLSLTLILTLLGSLMAQVNAIVLDHAVDSINALQHTEGGFSWSSAAKLLTTISIILLAKEVFSAFITFGQRYFGENIRINISRDMSMKVVTRISSFRMAYFSCEENEPGKLQTRITQGTMSLSNTVKNFFVDILPLFTSAVIALGLMFAANFYVGLVALLIIPIYFIITVRQGTRMKGGRRTIFRTHQVIRSGILNIIESIGVIKSFNREELETRKQAALQEASTQQQKHTRQLSFYFEGIKGFVEQIGTVLIIILTAYLVLTDYPGMSIGKIMYHVMLFNNVSAPIRQLHRIYDDLNDALIYAEAFFGILDAEEEVEKSGTRQAQTDDNRLGFVMKDVNFTYPNGNKALTDLSLTIEPGKVTALVGLSGAGKSTIVNLLDKFYTPDSGEITLCGIPLQEWDTYALRENIGLVLQKNHIFGGSIEENIRYGKPSATIEEIHEAARKAYIYDQVVALPDGFQTDALQLSGGQQQRVAIARMFLKNPPVIFLDEPTASLDAIATEQIKNSIDAIKKNRTVIIISHNIGQIIDSDVIYVLDHGHVVQHGTPAEVYHQGGLYKDIFDASARSMNAETINKFIVSA
ncbi:MAG: ABC transporter ATP-binding protein [Prevotella sp.]|nr:ABC transporter ATP-binding protein [Prevotella sp.]